MALFLVTLTIVITSCILLGAGLIVARKPLQGGCGHKPAGAPRCADCPNATRQDGKEGETV